MLRVLLLALVACGSPRSGSSGEPPLTCKQIISCDNGDAKTFARCIGRGSPEGVAQYQAIAECTTRNNCTGADCINARCPDELAACR